MTRFGTLYGIGVGPGDPDLITLKAVKTLQEVDVVLAAASSKNEASLALSIATGASDASALNVIGALFSGADETALSVRDRIIVFDIRMPRALLGFLLDICAEAAARPLKSNTFGVARL